MASCLASLSRRILLFVSGPPMWSRVWLAHDAGSTGIVAACEQLSSTLGSSARIRDQTRRPTPHAKLWRALPTHRCLLALSHFAWALVPLIRTAGVWSCDSIGRQPAKHSSPAQLSEFKSRHLTLPLDLLVSVTIWVSSTQMCQATQFLNPLGGNPAQRYTFGRKSSIYPWVVAVYA